MYALVRGPQPERVLPVGVVVRLPLDGIARAKATASTAISGAAFSASMIFLFGKRLVN